MPAERLSDALRRRARRAGLLATLLLALKPGFAPALTLDTPDRTPSLHRVAWGQQDGAPVRPTDMAQTQDGLLWLGASTGLYRFDARRFERVEFAGAPELQVIRLFAARDGGLWIGYLFNSVAYAKDGKLRAYGERDGLPGGGVMAFTQQSDGTMWVGTTRGLARQRGDRWETLDAGWKWPGGSAETLMADSQDRVWIRHGEQVFVLQPGAHELSPVPIRFGEGANFVESATGTVWIAGPGGLERLADNPPASHARWSTPTSVLFDDDGALWMRPSIRSLRSAPMPAPAAASAPDHYAFPKPLDPDPGLPEGWGEMLLLDRDGNLWTRTNTSLVRYSARSFVSLKSMPGWRGSPDGFEMALAPVGRAGLVFGDANRPGISLFDGRTLGGLPLDTVLTCAAKTRSGMTWVASRQGLWRLVDGRAEAIDLPPPLRGSDIVTIAEDADGGVWVTGIRTAVHRLAGGRWTAKGGVDALPDGQVLAIADDAAGRLWFGYAGGRVAMIDHGNVRVFGSEEGLRVGHVFALHARRGGVWIGGDSGLARFDGQRMQPIAVDGTNVLYSITGVVETEGGDVWLNTGAGIVRLPAAELALAAKEPAHRIWSELFDALDGIEGTSSQFRPVPTLVEGGEGQLWAGTNEDIYGIDPRHVVRRPVMPVTLQSLVVDDRPYALVGLQTLPRRAGTIKIAYGGGSLSAAEKVRYRYRLDGVDADWHSVQDRRDATYMNLAPGRYRFRVQDTWAGSPWPDAETTLDFEVPPAFVQTRVFLALCAVAAAFALWLLVQWRARQLARPMRIRFEARLAERLRIARDLHDTLLQSMLGFVLFVQGAAARLAPGHPVRTELDRALEAGQAGLAEGRDRILDLRRQAGLSASLPEALGTLVAQLETREGLAHVEIDVQGAVRPLVESVQEEVWCIAREALVNAFRHARAGTIVVRLDYAADGLVVAILDDGCGIPDGVDARIGAPGHWGLAGMAERARLVGGNLAVRPRTGGGTEVELRIPAARAFDGRAGFASRLPWRRRPGRSATAS